MVCGTFASVLQIGRLFWGVVGGLQSLVRLPPWDFARIWGTLADPIVIKLIPKLKPSARPAPRSVAGPVEAGLGGAETAVNRILLQQI